MKSIFVNKHIHIAFVAITVIASSLYVYSELSKNFIDEAGLRQGYWVITGAMVNEPAFDSTDIVEEGKYVDDLKNGVWKKYYPSGILRSEISFEQNKPIGSYTLYYENGIVEEQGNWQRNKNTGSFIRNYVNGNPHQRFEFVDSGKRDGQQLYYHENGELALDVTLSNGKEVGVMKRYNESGDLSEEKIFEKGELVQGSTKNHDSLKEEFVPQPAEVEKDSDVISTPTKPNEGDTNSAFHFQPNGHNILYDQNKNISQSGTFKDGRLWNGKWYKYNKNGILLRVDIYRNGKFIGHGLLDKE